MKKNAFTTAIATLCVFALGLGETMAAEFYIAPAGSNSNAGSLGSPWGSFDYAIGQINPGDTLFVRGGTYDLSSRIRIQKGGTEDSPINMWAYPGEIPILDFDSNPSTSDRGIQLERDWWHFRGLTIQNAPDNGVWVSGSNNIFEQLDLRWNGDSGLQLSGDSTRHPSNNLILNSDSYENYDPQNHGENADGFAAKFRDIGPGNVFRGDRAWGNSDDGWDFWSAAYGVAVENSWAFGNGINIWGDTAFAGDGNGIKLGHDSGTHVLENMLVWGNPANGVDVNGNATQLEYPAQPITHGVEVNNVTSYDNGNRNFRFDENFPHLVRNNISYDGSITINGPVDDQFNTWNGIPVNVADFLSLDDTIARGPRNADGTLPISDFLRLAADSNLIDAGTDVGLPFNGAAPDLGAFEFSPNIVYDPADFNEDGHVDGSDLADWQTGYGTASGAGHANGDADEDGDVDAADFFAWQRGYEAALNLAAAETVPEPTSISLLFLATVALGILRSATFP